MPRNTSNEYGNDSISSLKGPDRVRRRPAVIFGSDGLEGCQHSVFEIISNSIDEARAGFGRRILVTRYRDCSIEVQDFARGCPVDWNEKEQRYNWELVYCELYAGGKYNTLEGESYEYSLGLNGLGSCATQYSSRYMDVEVHRDGFCYKLHFERGELKGEMEKTPYKGKQTGSRHRWLPDLDVFTDISIPADWFRDILRRQAIVNQGLVFEFRNETENGFETQEFVYENGLTDYVGEILAGAGEDAAFSSIQYWESERRGRDRADKPEYKVRLTCAAVFSNRVKLLEYYHNSSWLEHGGAPDRAVRQAFVSQLDQYLKQGNRYLKGESRISFADVEDCLVLVSSSFSTQTSYENQTKKSINNKFIYEAMTDFLKHQLEVYFLENPDEANRIAEQVLVNKRSRENAEKARISLKKKLAGSIDLANRVQKFVDCRTKDLTRREIYIVEGDSALGSCKQGRDAEFQAIIPIRGKILNCLKAEYGKIFKNEIITDLIKVLGCGVEVSSKANRELSTFDLDNLRWSKVILCTDADVDGFHIRTMLLTMLYRLTPTLIEKGYVYIAESPLFEITAKEKGGERTYFAYTEQEKTEILEKLGKTKYDIQRSKGLGENDPEMMWLTTMNPETRRLIKVKPEDAEATARMFDLLLGDDLQGRKDFIAENGMDYLELADIS
ncbi:MAG: DNA topoisomerase [Oscillospiraceae bacterium]|jgi:DNA gyrase subunit B|nr:DNA topoisomerase [Oscillospiraceae bacterium]